MTKRIYTIVLFLALTSSMPLYAQVIKPGPKLAITNAVTIGRDDAIAKMKTDPDEVKRHLIFDSKAGNFKGVLLERKEGQMYIFDSTGLLDLILKTGENNNINVFDTHGKWLYVVRNKKHLFDAKGNMRAVLSARKGKIVMTRVNKPKKIKPVEDEKAPPVKEQE